VATPVNWQKVKQIVGEALERDSARRADYLAAACADDADLRAEVESLLVAHAHADLSWDAWGTTAVDAAAELRMIGPYRLVRTLGVGGMGQVWLAEQTEPVRRLVAIKLIRAGMYDDSAIRRFQSERQSLAIMDHPAIAKVFDAGATPAGQPYLAMEFVDGNPITTYCDLHRLGIRERLELFIQVCEGVQHAHQKAIVHRDLKPSNILVVEVDGKPRPRIIDFGLAKTTAPHVLGETLFTHVGAFLGTPGYMSPEQADPNVLDIDTRTDVYSLGVVLYELLTGFLPFDLTKWKQQRIDEVLRELRDSDPPPPSTKVRLGRDVSTEQSRARNTEPRQLVSLLRGDLDWITLKALEKERERRYGTPSALAKDVENYLANRPVEARSATPIYRMRKYIRRHALGAGIATAAAALLIAFATMQAFQLRRITRERDRADRVTAFMTNMFKVSDPSESRGNVITAREILDKSANEIDRGLVNDPELQAQMMHVMGQVYANLGLYSRAELILKQAVVIRSRVLGPEHLRTLDSRNLLVATVISAGRYAEAEKMARDALEITTRVLGPNDRTALLAKANLAWVLDDAGKIAEAGTIFQQTLDEQTRVLGAEDPDTLRGMYRYAVNLFSQGRYADAEKLDREALDIEKRLFGSEDYRTLTTMSDLGIELVWEHRDAEGEQLLRQTLDLQQRILGTTHQNTIATSDALGTAIQHQGRYPEAEQQFRDTLGTELAALGPDHPATLMTTGNLASALIYEQKYPEGERLLREICDRRRRILGPNHPDVALALYDLGAVISEEHRFREAAQYYRQAMDLNRRILGPEHPETVASAYNLARVLTLSGRHEEAVPLLEEAVEHGLSEESLTELQKSADWKSLRADPRFKSIMTRAAERVTNPTPDSVGK